MRWLYAASVATLAFVWQFVWYRNGGPVWALFLLSPIVPLLDRLVPGRKHDWKAAAVESNTEVSCAPSSVMPTAPSRA